ncbi:hypothetical protein LTR99_000712 [Exophiala xenobiotica]|uniref:Uncharacterized protein n=1 Tax=Vermiconidia calcicola TaxID=1690605 RepID=A0AAV9QP57_9PEZI|nr:hypothetical protein LTR72_000156 [Exophiala xenobiotica]KAK5545275.1 hypothetical protein LTR25_000282 [Vermiconidia calcicola]KAK5548128.1 hypothetical protein LTR23_001837 [Chaetothyriales sp. CCFEE 6169]KAK5274033.1 hypothetical protein LTR96_000633 [Exophiala xenobiotica]KAK5299490.1 hypothetical protein LTR14_001704 [Exophiala xenobiotica]
MNVFKKKAKAKDDAYIIPQAERAGSPSMSKMSRSLKRKQKNYVEIKPQIDLSMALPDTKDFRTSLLMPGLSARFSMLREQDDPNTKVGKASDDSVLFPKRVSRLNVFGHGPLTDIAEVESVHTPIRPPFADTERSHSFSEVDDTGSVVNRSRPIDGNNLFSGRQKMYKIPGTGSSRDLSGGQTPLTSTKHVYQNDVAMSSFQQLHLQPDHEREEGREAEEDEQRDEFPERPTSTETDDHERSSIVNTPSTGFSKSRATTSSVASAPSNRRTSTAATSVVSDSPIPRQSQLSAGSHSKGNNSDYGSDDSFLRRNPSSESRKAAQTSDQSSQPPVPSSPSFSRKVSQSKSVSNLSERYTRSTSPFPTLTPRAMSPPPSIQTQGLSSLDFGLKPSVGTLRRYQTASPTVDDQDDDVYSRSLQPNDRGKATAMGLFNRPQQQFNERKFEERQLQMYGAHPHGNEADHDSVNRGVDPTNAAKPSISPQSVPRSPKPSAAASRPRAQSAASSTDPVQVQAKVEALIKRQNEEYIAIQTGKPATAAPSSRPGVPKTLLDQPAATRGTFFNASDGSDDEEETDIDSPMLGRYEPPPRLAPMDVHPALRDDSQDPTVHDTRPRSDASAETSSPSVLHDTPDTSDSLHRISNTKEDIDSPTLGPATGLGLSGLIRNHLRHDSDRSSIMPPPSPGMLQGPQGNFSFRERDPSIASTARTINPPESTHSDPWEFDDAHRHQRSPLEHPSNDPIPSMSHKAQQILGQAMSHRNHAASKAQQVLGSNAPAPMDEHPATRQWQNDMMPSHQREESTETQKEFGNELAERARRIQEGLKGVAEAEKRSQSPGPRPAVQNPAAQALHALRHKTSKTSLVPRDNEPQPKATKMLGINGAASPAMGGRSLNVGGRAEFDDSSDEYGSRPPPRKRPTDLESSNGRLTPGPPRAGPWQHDPQENFERSRQRSATPTLKGPRRDRAESEAAERSRSRTGRYREEKPYPPAEYGRQGPFQRGEQQRSYGPHGPPRGPPPVDGRIYERSASAMSNRRPSGTRPGPSGYFDGRSATPTMAGSPRLGDGASSLNAPRPSPRPPFPHSPMSPFAPPGLSPGLPGHPSGFPAALPSPSGPLPQPPTASGRSTPLENRQTLIGSRKKSVTKGMISEPTFLSSTSTVPLVGLPNGPRPREIATPPVPAMNPQRRRAGTMTESSDGFPSPRLASPMPPTPASPDRQGFGMAATQHALIDQQQQQHRPAPRQRNRLRKISSEGGSMAAKARNQAMLAEFGRERLRSPALPVFPNRSATSLSLHQDGAMF